MSPGIMKAHPGTIGSNQPMIPKIHNPTPAASLRILLTGEFPVYQPDGLFVDRNGGRR